MKKTILILAAIIVIMSGCSGDAAKKLTVWSFTDEVEGMIRKYFTPNHPELNIQYSQTPADQFPNKLDPLLAAGRGVPDVFAMEVSFVRKYVESGLLLDLTDLYEANKQNILPYTVEIGTYNGRVYALSWQATPGAMFYRRSLAKKYLGTDDPAAVQAYFTNMDKFLDTAKLLREKSSGSCVVLSAGKDLLYAFYNLRKDPWVVNGKLVIDPAMEAYMDISKILQDNRLIARVGQWSEGWFAGMTDTLRDESGNLIEVFSYLFPTWGLPYVLKNTAAGTSGDWAMIPGPASFYGGGTFLGAWKNTKNPEAAKKLINFLTVDEDFLEKLALDTGEFVSNTAVVNRIKDNFSEAFLGGQNHYAAFAEMAGNIDGSLAQGTDLDIIAIFDEQVFAYVNGEKTKAQALADFRLSAETSLGL